jgi:hypothetical protein
MVLARVNKQSEIPQEVRLITADYQLQISIWGGGAKNSIFM